MISPSDATGSAPDPTVAGQGPGSHSPWPAGSVMPLQFEKIDHPLRRRTDWLLNGEGEPVLDENRLRDDLAAAEIKLRAQTHQAAAQLAEARTAARLEGRREVEAECTARITQEREQIALLCAEFAKVRAGYFAAVEAEVVRLALGIAARVLHREAKLDPLLLAAVVRMALEKVEDDSQAVLHVPVKDAEAWRALLHADHQGAVRVVGEDRMGPSECTLETTIGRVELGVCAQLEEIEKGFFDLLQQRPA